MSRRNASCRNWEIRDDARCHHPVTIGSVNDPGKGEIVTDRKGADKEAARKAKLAEALRANLRKRKAQASSAREGRADTRSGLPAAGPGLPEREK
jgi:hypothetical protein